MWLCQDVGVSQLIQCVNALVCVVNMSYSLTCILFCFCCACMVGVEHLFLQLFTFTGCDCLLSRSLLGDLLHVFPLSAVWVPFSASTI